MTEVPDFMRAAMVKAGVDPDEVAQQAADPEVIPTDAELVRADELARDVRASSLASDTDDSIPEPPSEEQTAIDVGPAAKPDTAP